MIWNDRIAIVAALLAMAAIYAFALREPFSVSRCHISAERTARNLLQQRLLREPDNQTLQSAARSNLYANEDYLPTYKSCLMKRGYER